MKYPKGPPPFIIQSSLVVLHCMVLLLITFKSCNSFTPLYNNPNLVIQSSHHRYEQKRQTTRSKIFSSLLASSSSSSSSPSSPSSTNNNDNNQNNQNLEQIEDQMLSIQKEKSGEIEDEDIQTSTTNTNEMNLHLKRQQKLFDDLSTFFNSQDATPDEVKPLLSFIMNQVLNQMVDGYNEGIQRKNQRQKTTSLSSDDDGDGDGDDDGEAANYTFRILDVGCGVGALFPFYIQQANEVFSSSSSSSSISTIKHNLEIVGLDLSSKMITFAKENANELLLVTNSNDDDDDDDESNMAYAFDFIQGDFVQSILGEDYDSNGIKEESIVGYVPSNGSSDDDEYVGQYDAVVINACFGNFYDQEAVLTAASQCLKNDGIVAITHPLGAQFVDKLKAEDPETVLHSLPSLSSLQQMIQESQQPLQIVEFIEEIDADADADANFDSNESSKKNIYYASMKRVPQRLLNDVIYLRGPVDAGYGRGGKKLGIPTANLPCSLFSNALQDVPTGVYFGWAVVESDGGDSKKKKKGRDEIHKAVVNVGYSPTFDGEENKEKIVEAHLIVDDGTIDGDFYGETMRLSLYGFLRPEMKFESFPALIEAIMNDKANAKDALDISYFQEQREESFLSDLNAVWIGTSGGDKHSSYQFGS